MSVTYPYNQQDQTYPYNNPNQAYPLNYFASVVANQVLLNFVQTTWQAFTANPQTISMWLSNNQLTLDQVISYLNNWLQLPDGQGTYGAQLSVDYISPTQTLPWINIINNSNMTLQAISGFFASQYIAYTALMNFMGSGLPQAVNITNWAVAIEAASSNLVPAIANAISMLGANNVGVTTVIAVISNPTINTNMLAQIISSPAINITGMAMVLSNPLMSTTLLVSAISQVPVVGNITGMAMVLTNSAMNSTLVAQIFSSASMNYSAAGLIISNPAVYISNAQTIFNNVLNLNWSGVVYMLNAAYPNYTTMWVIATNSSVNITYMAYVLSNPAINTTNIGYIYAQSIVQPATIYSILSNAGMSATYAQLIYYAMASAAITYGTENNVIGFVTYNQPSVTLSASVSATWTLFYSSLELAGYTLTMGTTGRPSVIVTYAIQMSGGAIVQQPTGAYGGGAGGGGLVIITVTGVIDGTISAVGQTGTYTSPTAYSGYMITIEGIINLAATGGAGGTVTYSAGGGGGVKAGYSFGNQIGGGDPYIYNYSTPQSYVYTMLKFLGDEWQRQVLGRTLSSYVGATYLAGYGAAGGQGSSTVASSTSANAGGGQGGEIIIYMHNLFAPTVAQISAMGGAGGPANAAVGLAGGGGGGGAGGLVYVLTHNIIAFSGMINVQGGIGETGVVGGSAGTPGGTNVFAIFIV